jgi:hypothetical protein
LAKGKPVLACLIAAHWQLHGERPLQFRLAERDFCCLSEAQQARLLLLRERYEAGLLRLIAPQARLEGAALAATGHVLATLLNQLPGWLRERDLGEAQGLALMESPVLGGIERTSASLRSPPHPRIPRGITLRQHRADHQLDLVEQHQQDHRPDTTAHEQHLGHRHAGGQAFLGAREQDGDAVLDTEPQHSPEHAVPNSTTASRIPHTANSPARCCGDTVCHRPVTTASLNAV